MSPKPIVALGILISLSLFAQSQPQPLPNGGFESWIFFGGWYENPEFWQTNNNQIMTAFVEKDTFAYMGQFAMKVNTQGHAKAGFKFMQSLLGISGMVKTNIVAPDTVIIKTRFFLGGVVVDSGAWEGTLNFSSWSSFIVMRSGPFGMNDSVEVEVSGGNSPGNTISVDELFWLTSLSIEDSPDGNNISIFPNPSSGELVLESTFSLTDGDIRIFNSGGQMVFEMHRVSGQRIQLNVEAMSTGGYFVLMNNKGHPPVIRKFILE